MFIELDGLATDRVKLTSLAKREDATLDNNRSLRPIVCYLYCQSY